MLKNIEQPWYNIISIVIIAAAAIITMLFYKVFSYNLIVAAFIFIATIQMFSGLPKWIKTMKIYLKHKKKKAMVFHVALLLFACLLYLAIVIPLTGAILRNI